ASNRALSGGGRPVAESEGGSGDRRRPAMAGAEPRKDVRRDCNEHNLRLEGAYQQSLIGGVSEAYPQAPEPGRSAFLQYDLLGRGAVNGCDGIRARAARTEFHCGE